LMLTSLIDATAASTLLSETVFLSTEPDKIAEGASATEESSA
jgi:hypothetical protein